MLDSAALRCKLGSARLDQTLDFPVHGLGPEVRVIHDPSVGCNVASKSTRLHYRLSSSDPEPMPHMHRSANSASGVAGRRLNIEPPERSASFHLAIGN